MLEQQVQADAAVIRARIPLRPNFAYQWLSLQKLKEADPDGLLYPNFSRQLGDAMMRETEFVFENMVREDKSPVELLTANYTFVNETLAKHYGIPNVSGDNFRRVELADPESF